MIDVKLGLFMLNTMFWGSLVADEGCWQAVGRIVRLPHSEDSAILALSPTYILESLVLLFQFVVGLQQLFLDCVMIVLKLLHFLLKVVNLLLGLYYLPKHKKKKRA